MSDVGAELKALRAGFAKGKGIGLIRLGKRAGIAPSYLHDVETGARPPMGLANLKKLLTALNRMDHFERLAGITIAVTAPRRFPELTGLESELARLGELAARRMMETP